MNTITTDSDTCFNPFTLNSMKWRICLTMLEFGAYHSPRQMMFVVPYHGGALLFLLYINNAIHQIPPRPGGPFDSVFTSSVHCRQTANSARRLLFMVRRSFSDISKAAFISLYYALVLPHLENAMEANSSNPRADINQLQRIQRLAACLVRCLRHVSYEERLHQFNSFSLERRRLRADLILAVKIFKEVDINPSYFFLHPLLAGLRGYTRRLLQVPSRPRRKSGAFSVRAVKSCNRLPVPLALSKKSAGCLIDPFWSHPERYHLAVSIRPVTT